MSLLRPKNSNDVFGRVFYPTPFRVFYPPDSLVTLVRHSIPYTLNICNFGKSCLIYPGTCIPYQTHPWTIAPALRRKEGSMEPTTCSSSSSNVLLIFSRSTSDGRHSRSNSSTSERDGLGRFPGRGLGAKWVYVMWTRSNWISARSPPSTPLEGKMATYLSQQEKLLFWATFVTHYISESNTSSCTQHQL